MPAPKVKVNGKWYNVGMSSSDREQLLSEANAYAQELSNNMQQEINEINEALENLDGSLDEAFKDGIISEAEAKIIESHIRILASKKVEMDREYGDIFGNVYISQASKDSLSSAKGLYDTEYTDLINEIYTAIADSKASEGEVTLVDQAFTNYNNALSLLISALRSAIDQISTDKSAESYQDSIDYTDGKIAPVIVQIQNAESQITQNAQEIQSRVTQTQMETTMGTVKQEAITEANTYADGLKQATDTAIGNLQTDLADTQTYVDNSFRDGIITSLEASGIANYLNTLATSKKAFDSSYSELSLNAYLKGTYKTNLETAKSGLDTAHSALTLAINNAIIDNTATAEEKTDVDTKFQLYNDSVSTFSLRVEQAIDSIAREKALEAEMNANDYTDGELVPVKERLVTAESTITQHANMIDARVTTETYNAGLSSNLTAAQQYADGLKEATDSAINTLQGQVNATDEYIDNAFRDGIIYEAEYKKIQAYLNTLNESKITFDNRYSQIYGNLQLVGTPKTDLSTAKSNYDTKYDALVTTINNAIADQLADVTESQAVDTAFVAYNNSIALLSTALERAIDAIAQAKADEAEELAKGYADTLKSTIDGEIQALQSDIDATNTYIDESFRDGVVTEAEAKRIGTYINILNESKSVFDQRYMEIYNNTSLGATYKSDLGLKKSNYDTAYTDLTNTINSAVADGFASSTESTAVNNKFATYNTAASDLTNSIEKAINNIAQNKADSAQANAEGYADGVVAPIDNRLKTAESNITILDEQIGLRVTTTTFNEVIADTKSDAETYTQTYVGQQLQNYVDATTYGQDMQDLQSQLDGNITSWFKDYAPTLANEPASLWTTNELKNIHLGDLFYDNLTGYAYRFAMNGTAYEWVHIQDNDVQKALQDAAKAQDTADSKRRVFYVTPTTPYEQGDLWSQGSAGDLMRCKVTRLTGSYVATDWEKASKYTDDTVANNNLATAKTYAETKANEAKTAAEEYALAQAEAERVKAEAYADGIVDAEEQARISDANAKLAEAKSHADTKASEAQAAAEAYAEAQADAIQVGGTNLLKNSKNIGKSMAVSVATSQAKTDETEEYTRFTNTAANGYGYVWVDQMLTLPIELGAEYTVSCQLRSDTTGDIRFGVRSNATDGVHETFYPYVSNPSGGKWVRVQQTFKYTKAFDRTLLLVGATSASAVYDVKNFKIEKGNKSTDWSPAPEDVQQEIDNIQVGGRNLVTKSGQNYLVKTSYASDPRMEEGRMALPFENSSNIAYLDGTNYTLEGGQEYTFSFFAKASEALSLGSGTSGGVYIGPNNKGFLKSQAITTTWTRYQFTFTAANTEQVKLHVYPVIANADGTYKTFYVTEWKLEKGNRATDWTPAPEDVQGSLDKAQSDATSALSSLGDISNDSKLTAGEKQIVKTEWDVIVAEKATIEAQATTFSITTEKTAYTNSYDTLAAYIVPLLTNLTTTSNITRSTFRANFKNYYTARTNLLKRITDASKGLVDNLQVGGRNLAHKDAILPWVDGFTETNYVYTLSTTTGQAGLAISETVFTQNALYVLSFKAKKISGDVTNMAGHGAIIGSGTEVYMDGNLISNTWSSGNPYPNDTAVHEFKVFFKSSSVNPFTSNERIYIQPNRSTYGKAYVMEIWDLKLERGNKVTDWTPAPEDIEAQLSFLETEMFDVKIQLNESSIVSTVMNSTTYQAQIAEKANAEDLANYATTGQMEAATSDIQELNNAINSLDFTPYATKSELEQTTKDITAKFSATGGMNLIRNSIGFSGIDFWGDVYGNGLVQTIVNNELEVLGFGSGFQMTADASNKGIYQIVDVAPNLPYNLSWYYKKTTASTVSNNNFRFFVQIEEDLGAGWAVQFNLSDNSTEVTDGYKMLHTTYIPQTTQIRVRFIAYKDCTVSLTGILLTIGDVPLKWSLATGEVYNTNIRLDRNGIRVEQSENGETTGITVMTPEKFAGYYDVNGDGIVNTATASEDEVFRMDKDEFVMKKATVESEITMGSIKIVQVDGGGNKGWAFVPISS